MPNGMTGGVSLDGCNAVTTLPQSKIRDFCQLPQNEGAEGAPAPEQPPNSAINPNFYTVPMLEFLTERSNCYAEFI